jgi:hypothetical protein
LLFLVSLSQPRLLDFVAAISSHMLLCRQANSSFAFTDVCLVTDQLLELHAVFLEV